MMMSSSALLRICRRLFILILVLFFLNEAGYVLRGAALMFQRFRASGWDYEERRRDFTEALPLMELRTLLPEGAVVEWPKDGSEISPVAARYILYPFRVLPEGNYIIDFKGDRLFPPEGHVIRLPNHAQGYAKPGFDFIPARGAEKALSLPRTAVLSLSFILFQTVLGAAFLKIFGFPPCRRMPLFYSGLSFLTGYLFFTLSLWLAYLAGLGTMPFNLLLVSGVVLWWTVFIIRKQAFTEFAGLIRQSARAVFSRPGLRSFLPGILLASVCAGIVFMTVLTPVTDWDGMSHWILKSKIMAFENKLDFSYTHNNYYPLLWPLNIAAQFVVTGGLYDAFAKWTSTLFFLVFVGIFGQTLQSLSGSREAARVLTALFLVLSFRVPDGRQWFYNYIQGNAENIFLAFLAGLLFMAVRWLQSRESRYLVMASVLGAGLALAKLEGAVAVAAVVFPLWGLSRQLKISRKEVYLLGGLTCLLALPLLWIMWVNGHGYGEAMMHASSLPTFGKIVILAERIGGYALQDLFVILVLMMIGVALTAAARHPWTPVDKFLLLTTLGLLLFSVFAIAGWPEAKLKTTSMEVFQRLFLHASPAALMFFVSRLCFPAGHRDKA